MNIYLLRHGFAAARDSARFPDDSLRPLTVRGQKQVRKIAKAMRRWDLGIDLIMFSPLLRTRQTAEAVAEQLELIDRAEAHEPLAPNGDPRKLLHDLLDIKSPSSAVLLVGHEPYLTDLLLVLISGGSRLNVEMKKGGLAKLQVTGTLHFGQCAILKWLLPPFMLIGSGPSVSHQRRRRAGRKDRPDHPCRAD